MYDVKLEEPSVCPALTCLITVLLLFSNFDRTGNQSSLSRPTLISPDESAPQKIPDRVQLEPTVRNTLGKLSQRLKMIRRESATASVCAMCQVV